MAAGAGLAMDRAAEGDLLGTRLRRREKVAEIEGMAGAQGRKFSLECRPVGALKRAAQALDLAALSSARLADEERQGRERPRKPRAQTLALGRRHGRGGEPPRVTRYHDELDGKPPPVLVLRAGGEGERRRERQDESPQACYGSFTFCSIGPAFRMDHSAIEPSYILAFLLPSSSLATNQPSEERCPVLQNTIWSPLTGTPATR